MRSHSLHDLNVPRVTSSECNFSGSHRSYLPFPNSLDSMAKSLISGSQCSLFRSGVITIAENTPDSTCICFKFKFTSAIAEKVIYHLSLYQLPFELLPLAVGFPKKKSFRVPLIKTVISLIMFKIKELSDTTLQLSQNKLVRPAAPPGIVPIS
ncbi:unnamed protein product [Lepeophtheirus salmonis]|uniref:(salmon louse) hypothetical protein n=1 Tax=Lepeophtheirus salmonis TaxID=72036 RepID=A0A817FDI9_LEPSM|nr:unnamed protein product [Lepeophtheirus salmonis]CAG9478029.1 unnamed protein product [Lepeophtheirus salmonis]